MRGAEPEGVVGEVGGWSGGCSQGLAAAPGLSGWVGVGGPHIHADVQQMCLKKVDYLT